MDMNSILQKVDKERLYRHILQIEGVKNPITNPEKLEQAANYIKNELKSYGLLCNEHEFKLDDFNLVFKNIEGFLDTSLKSEVLITSHYDTVHNSPGANDNGTAIAVMLEAARIIAEEKIPINIHYISFTLEEYSPSYLFKTNNYARELGLIDENNRYTSAHTQKIMKKHYRLYVKALVKFNDRTKISKYIFDQLEGQLTNEEKKYLEFLHSLTEHLTPLNWIGQSGLIGSSKWVEKALEEKREIIGVINIETVGYTSTRNHSQYLPTKLFKLFPRYKIKIRKEIGNFIAIASDKNSKKLAKEFCKSCKRKEIELPYVSLQIPMNFEGIAHRFRDILRSDHAPFWRAGIPALMLTDTANFRYPYYHTEADTIDKLDFDFITKVCQATIATVITYAQDK